MIAALERRPGMYVQPESYETIVAYISGYDHAIVDQTGKSELDAFAKWICRRRNYQGNLHWSVMIRDFFAKKDNEKAIAKLFELFREFGAADKKSKAG